MKDSQTKTPPSDEVLGRLIRFAGPRPEPTAEMRDEVYAGVHDAWRARTHRGRSLRRLTRVAIAASVAGIVAFLIWPSRQEAPVFAGSVGTLDRGVLEVGVGNVWRPVRSGDALPGSNRIRTGTERAGLILTNGISVRLDHDTQLQLDAPDRLALSHGRLYVDTAEKSVRDASITIVTSGGTVRDIGTQFEVHVDASLTRVRVRDGEITLSADAEEFRAGRGEALVMTPDGNVARTAVVSNGASWDWILDVAPRFDTDGRRVSELISWVGRETGRQIQYSDALTRNAAAATRIRGTVSGVTPVETLDLALETTRFDYRLEDTVLLIDKNP